MLLKKRPVAVVFLLGLVLSPLLTPRQAQAIPAFSRQYKTECSTCHTIYPELNEFGEAFLKNSYVYPGKKGAAEKGAAEGPKDTKSEWAWLSGIPERIPVSFTGAFDLAWDDDAIDGDKVDFSTRSLRLHAGGAFREAAGFFVTYNAYTQGQQRGQLDGNPVNNGNVPPNNTPNIDEMYLIWRHALGTPVNVKAGRFEPKLSLWKRSNKVIPVPAYASTSYLVGISPFSVDSRQDGVELNGLIGSRFFLAAGVVDRNGMNHKDFYGHASYKISGTDYKGEEPEVDLEHESLWDFLTITVGAFGYSGRNGEYDPLGVARNRNEFYRAGGDLDVLYKRLHLKGSGTFGRDSNPLFLSSPESATSHAFTVEGEYYLGAPINLVPVFRYEYLKEEGGATNRYIPALAYAPLQNIRLALELIYTDAPAVDNTTVVTSAAFSF